MTDTRTAPVAQPGATGVVAISGYAAQSAFGRGVDALRDAAVSGHSGFAPVTRFDVTSRRVGVAATSPDSPVLRDELAYVVDEACDLAKLTAAERAECPLLLAVHGDPALGRTAVQDFSGVSADALARSVAERSNLSTTVRPYTTGCVAASTAVADAGAMTALGRAERVVVAAGYLVESDQFALFDAGRALATDGRVRPFSTGRSGLLLGDGVAAVVVESGSAARRRSAPVLAHLAGWGRAGDAYHVVQPRPDGAGLAKAITLALVRAGARPSDIGYLNAHGTGTPKSDVAEANALRHAFGDTIAALPVSSTKSIHGQALEASGLLELILTILALRTGDLPVNAGFVAPDAECPLDVVTAPRTATLTYAMSVNSAFGGANTALVVSAP